MKRLALASILMVALTQTASADLRSFTRTYEYATQPAGKTAIELYHTQSRATWDSTSPQTFDQQVEIEHGITDHWDVAFYSVFKQVAGDAMTSEPFRFDEIKLRTRYRLADRGEWPVDTLLYFEVVKVFGDSVYEFEGKAIVARDFEKLTVAANVISAVKVGNDVEATTPELGYAAGATYQVHPKLRCGAESWGVYDDGTLSVSAGPAVSWAPASDLWIALTAGFGIADEADAFSARAILGIEL